MITFARKLSVKSVLTALSLCFALTFLGCEIGLGPAVDIEAPIVRSITKPDVNDAVGSDFTIEGTASDDTVVKSVRILKLRNLNDGEIVYENLGSVTPSSDGKWKISFTRDENGIYSCNGRELRTSDGRSLPDGTYVVDMVASDESQDSTAPRSLPFDIDNTPPLFFVSSPSSLNSSSDTEYGRNVRITGTIADAHGIKWMKIRAFDEDNNPIEPLAKSEFEGFDKANTSVTIASYSSSTNLIGDERLLQENYMKMFGESGLYFDNVVSAGAKIVNISVEICDTADNVSNRVFLASNLNRLVKEETSINSGVILDSNEYMKIATGTYTGTVLSAGDREKVADALNDVDATYSDTYNYVSYDNGDGDMKTLSFSMDPNNAPKYTAAGFDLSGVENKDIISEWPKFTTSGEITINVVSGKDGRGIYPNTLSVKIFKAESDGSFSDSSSNLMATYDSGLFKNDTASVFDIESATQNSSYGLKLPTDGVQWRPGDGYYIVVYGHDEAENELLPSKAAGFGFQIVASGTAPYLSTEHNAEYVGKESVSSSFQLYYNDVDATVRVNPVDDAIRYTVTRYLGHYENGVGIPNDAVKLERTGAIRSADLVAAGSSTTQYRANIPLVIPTGSDLNNNYTYVIKATPRNNQNNGYEHTFFYYLDGKAPEYTVSNTELTTTPRRINSSSTNLSYENTASGKVWTYEIRGNVSDAGGKGVEKVQVKYNNGEWVDATSSPQVTSPAAGWSHRIVGVTSGNGQSIWVRALDQAGNTSGETKYESIVIDFDPPTIALDQVNGVGASELAPYYNDDVTLRFAATDNVGIPTPNITGYKNGVKDESLSTSGNGPQRTVKLENEGNWRLVVYAKDLAEQKSQETVFETCLDKTKPTVDTLTVDGTPNNGYYSSSMLKVNVAYTEELSGLSSVSYKIKKPDGSYTDLTEESASGTGGTFSITPSGFSAESGGVNTLYVKLKDKAGNESDVKNLTVKVDQGAPTVDVSYYGTNATQPVDIPGTVYFKAGDTSKRYLMGKVSDDGGIGSVKLKNGNEEITAVVKYTTTAGLASASNFAHVEWKTYDLIPNKYSITGWMAEFSTPSADCTVSVTATDLAGLDSSVRNVMTFKKDEVAPTLSDINLNDNGNISEDDISSEIYTLRGTWLDEGGSGTETLKWRLNDTGDWNDVGASTAPKTTTPASWYIEIPKSSLTAGNGRKINLKATDAAGNETVKDITGISVDYQTPTLTIISVNGTGISNVAGIYKKDSSPLTLVMASQDDQGIQVIEVVSAKRNGESVTSGYTFSANIGNTTNETATLRINRNGTQDGKWDFEIRSKDKAGRTSPTVKVSTTVDGTDPTIDLDGLKVENEAWTADSWYRNNILRVSASAEDTEGGSGLESVYYKVVQSNESASYDDLKSLVPSATSAALSGSSAEFTVAVSDLQPSTSSVKNRLLIQAYDAAGNKTPVQSVILGVDMTLPTLKSMFYTYNGTNFGSASGTIMTNGNNDLVLYGNVNDYNGSISSSQSGIAELVLKSVAGGSETDLEPTLKYSTVEITNEASINPSSYAPYNASNSRNIKSFMAVIPKEKLESCSVKATVTDIAGNSYSQSLFSLALDDEAPTITLKNPVTKMIEKNGETVSDPISVGSLNGSVVISGSATDASLSSVHVYTRVGTTGEFAELTHFNGAAAYNWSTDPIPMSEGSGSSILMFGGNAYAGTGEDVYVKVVAYDTAENFTSQIYRYNVDPDSDRPIITFNNVELSDDDGLMSDSHAVGLKTKMIFGQVGDDDGVLEMAYAVQDPETEELSDWEPVTVSNGTWKITLEDDGPAKVFFRVTDVCGTVFASALTRDDANQYMSPKLSSAGTDLDKNSVLNVVVDTEAPVVGNNRYQLSTDGNTWEEESEIFSTGLFGGVKKFVRFKIDAHDTNGIKKVEFKIGGTAYSVDHANSTENTSYCSEKIDISGFASGTYTLSTSVTDNAGSTELRSGSFYIDNTKPGIEITNPGQVSSYTSIYGTIKESETDVYYNVAKTTAPVSKDSPILDNDADYAIDGWQKVNDASLSFNVWFDGNDLSGTHTQLLKWYISALGIAEEEKIRNGTYTDYADLVFSILAIDKYGNWNMESTTVSVDPQGDKPTVKITNPRLDTDENGQPKLQTLGGMITVMGTATDFAGKNPGVDGVGVMIDVDNDGDWDYDDISTIHDLNDELKFGFYNSSSKEYSEIGFTSIPKAAATYRDYSLITELSGNAWYLSINEDGEFNEKPILTVWAVAFDRDGNTSYIDLSKGAERMPNVSFKIDSDTPQIANKKLTRTLADGEEMEQMYSNGMYIRQKWYFEADVYDDNGIDEISIGGVKVVSKGEVNSAVCSENGITVDTYSGSVSDVSGFHIKKPVGKIDDTSVYTEKFAVTCYEKKTGTRLTGNENIVINIDNRAPSLAEEDDSEYNFKTDVVDTLGFYTFGSKARETAVGDTNQTGVDRIAFYFTRDIKGTGGYSRIYDPMRARKKDGEAGENNYIENYSTALTYSDGLYWSSATVSGNTGSSITFTTDLPKHVHKGGLVKVKGVIYTIKDMGDDSITVDGNVSIASGKQVQFALANVVDNPIQEGEGTGKNEAGYWTNPSLDDGDNMVESLINQGDSWIWQANIITKNLGDGKAVLHYTVFDAAGNFATRDVDITVMNNRPKIAGVVFKTDDDADEDYAGWATYNMYSRCYENVIKKGSVITDAVFPTESTDAAPVSLAVVRNKIQVVPEVIGGNGKLDWNVSVYERQGAGWKSEPTGYLENSGADIYGNEDETVTELELNMSVVDMKKARIADGENEKLVVNISDETPGSPMSASVSLILTFRLDDYVDPVIGIRPLYWNGKNDNSLFGNSTGNGHIELPKDLPAEFTVDNPDKEMDRHPKVSGKIRLEGVAKDDSQLGEIKIAFFGRAEQTVGTYTGGKWVSAKPLTEGGQIPEAGYAFEVSSDVTFADLVNSGIIDSVPSGKRENEYVPQFAGYGHVAKWTAYVDTEKICFDAENECINVAASDQTITVTAYDRGSPDGTGTYSGANDSELVSSQSGGDDGTGTVTGFYVVDVVPYITGVTTKLSSLNKNDPSVYARTARGHYAVADKEQITIKGFNLTGGTVTYAKEGGTVTDSYTGAAKAIPAEAKSGEVSVTVNGIVSLNNKNNNDSKGSYTGTVDLSVKPTGDRTVYDIYYYNRQPNGDNNNLLTDDVVLDVWQINSQAAVPISGSVSQPVMAINPHNHDVGFAFVNGTLYYSMPNGDSYSYDNFIGGFDYWTSVAMTYDSLGNSYGTAAGGDINETKADQFRIMTSRWGYADRHAGGYNTGTNNLRLELIGQYDYTETTNAEGNHEGFRNFDKERIRSPSLATGSATSTSTTVYLAYYDAINDEIRFKWGELKATKDKTWKDLNGTQKTASFFGDYYGSGSEAGDKVLADDKDYSKYRTVHNSWLAGQTSRIYDTSGNTREAKVVTTAGIPVNAGQYVSIAAIPGGGTDGDDAVVAVWWDTSTSQLLYSYNLTPKSIAVGEYKQEDTEWTTPVPIFAEGIGEYCKVAVIKEGSGTGAHYSVHIVGYDGQTCDVWYAYLQNFTNSSSKKTCIVDSYGLIGTELNIDVALNSSGNAIPYISYYAGSCAHPKTAHWAGTTSLASATTLGSVDDEEYFTGAWEVSIIPTQSKVSEDHINIGVWKDSSGKITWSTMDGEAPGEDNIGETKLDYKEVFTNNSNNTGYKTGGHVWGNGSKNPVLGYAITKGSNGYIETAQMK